MGEDSANKERSAGLLRFASTHNESEVQNVSFADYISRMKEGQDKIYYVSADSYSAAKHSPHLDVFKQKDIEVLLLSERVDEWMLSFLTEFGDKALVSVAKGGLDLADLADEEEKEKQEKVAEELKPFIEKLKSALGDKVKEVRTTSRLVDSPACVVVDENEMSPHLLRMLQAAGQPAPDLKPILEINPGHTLIAHIDAANEEDFADWAAVLLDQAMLAEGAALDEPAAFVQRMNRLLLKK